MAAKPLFDRADFRLRDGIAHVCAGGETAVLRRHGDAVQRYLEDKSAGMPGRTSQEEQIERARRGIAALFGVTAAEIGLVSNVAEGMAIVAESIDWRDGDSMVIDEHEYPSVVAPIMLRDSPRVDIRIARGGGVDRYDRLVNARTRLIGVSCVSYLTGERHDLVRLRALADSVGAMLVVDYTQAAGYLPIEARIADFAFSACYKWILGITGVAAAYWNQTRQPGWAPASAGWHSLAPGTRGYDQPLRLRDDAMRFTRGNPAHASVYVLAEALDYLRAYRTEAIHAHVETLVAATLQGLRGLNVPVMTPADPARHGANVCVASPHAQAMTDALMAHDVWAWNGHGRIRFSFHGYNDLTDVERIVAGMRAVWRG